MSLKANLKPVLLIGAFALCAMPVASQTVKISGLPAATTPLGGSELVPIVQSGVTKNVSVTNLRGTASGVTSFNSRTGAVSPTSGDYSIGQISGLGTGVATFLGTPTSANLASALTDETGTGAAVFANGPTLIAPVLGTPASGNASNLTNIPVANATGVLPAANGGAGTVSGILQANGSGTVAATTIGNGLNYSSPTLSLTNTLNNQTGTSYAVATTDAAKIITGSNASAMGYTIVQATTTGYTSGFGTTLANINAPGGTNITLTATTSTFGNGLTSIVLAPGQVADIGSNGTNYPFTAVSLPVMAADTVLGNFSGTSNYPIAGALSSCSAATNAVTYNTSTHSFGCGSNHAVTNAANSFTGMQSNGITTLSISTATFTPDASNNNYKLTLVHASCPCTLANPSSSLVAGTAGTIEIIQSSTGSDTIGTWGSSYIAPGGTSTITLSTGANAIDVLSYFVIDSTHILLVPAALNASH